MMKRGKEEKEVMVDNVVLLERHPIALDATVLSPPEAPRGKTLSEASDDDDYYDNDQHDTQSC